MPLPRNFNLNRELSCSGHIDTPHVHQNLLLFLPATSVSDFTEVLGGAFGATKDFWKFETVANRLGLCEARIQPVEMRL